MHTLLLTIVMGVQREMGKDHVPVTVFPQIGTFCFLCRNQRGHKPQHPNAFALKKVVLSCRALFCGIIKAVRKGSLNNIRFDDNDSGDNDDGGQR